MKLAETLFGSAAKVSLRFADAETRRTVPVKVGDKEEQQFLFGPDDNITGTVNCAHRSTPPASLPRLPRAAPPYMHLFIHHR